MFNNKKLFKLHKLKIIHKNNYNLSKNKLFNLFNKNKYFNHFSNKLSNQFNIKEFNQYHN